MECVQVWKNDFAAHSRRLYRWASQPLRALIRWRLCRQQRAPVIVLFYHRVADDFPNPWTIRNDTFAEQIEWLGEHFDFVSLVEAQRRLRHGSRRPCVHITFDDGYADNCHQALPLLIRRGIPVTYFVTLDNVLNQKPFAHDVARGEPLRPNALSEIRALCGAGIEIGNHTRSHRNVAALRSEELDSEVIDAGKELADRIGKPIRYFAFPFGQVENMSLAAAKRLYDAGYEGVCSAYGGYNLPGEEMKLTEAFHLQRFHGDPLMPQLQNWLTLDPRHVFKSRKWDPPRVWFEQESAKRTANVDNRRTKIEVPSTREES